MGITFAGLPCLNPRDVWESCRAVQPPLPIDDWWGKANSFTCKLGQKPGRGHLLMTGISLNALDKNAKHNLVFAIDNPNSSVALLNLVFVQAKAITPGYIGDDDTAYLVEVADRRLLYQGIPINTGYNLPARDGEYFTASLNLTGYGGSTAGSPWTWTTMIKDIWNNKLIGKLGSFSGLPFTPDGTPEGFAFFGMTALDALDQLLTRIGCALQYDPTTDLFDIVRVGVADLAEVREEVAFERLRTWDTQDKQSILAYFPHYVQVYFRQEPYPGDGKTPYDLIAIATGIAGAEPNTYVVLHDDLVSRYDASGNLLNLAALTSRANERAADYVRIVQMGRANKIYAGAQETFVPGSQIAGVWWGDLGQGYKTEIIRTPIPGVNIPPEREQEPIIPTNLYELTVQDTRFCTQLYDAVTAGAASISVQSSAQFPATGSFTIQIDDEVMLVTAGAGTTTWSVTRAQNGTTAQAHNQFSYVCWLFAITSTLNGAITAVASTLTINTVSSRTPPFPSLGRYYIQIDNEILLVLDGPGSLTPLVWTVARGMYGTTPASHANGATVVQRTPDTVREVRRMYFDDMSFVQPHMLDPNGVIIKEPVQLVAANNDADANMIQSGKIERWNDNLIQFDDDLGCYVMDANALP